jgi:hypothetical protein
MRGDVLTRGIQWRGWALAIPGRLTVARVRPKFPCNTMRPARARWLGVLLLVYAASCASPTEPKPAPAGYAGQWTGTTAQHTPVSFSVAGDEVTSFNLAFSLSSTCSGSVTLPGPVQIVMQVPPGPPPFDQPGFAMGLNANGEWGAAVAGGFSADRGSASGEFKLVQYPGCDVVTGGTWTVRRR